MTTAETVSALPEACAVYGCGTFGRSLVVELEGLGVEVVAVVDHLRGSTFDGRQVDPPESLAELPPCPVLLGICNPHAKVAEIVGDLGRFVSDDIWSPVRIFAALGAVGETRTHYWLTTDLDLYERASAEIALARNLLDDERSRTLFDALLAYRISGEIEALPPPDPATLHYQPADLVFIDGTVNLLDGGAYRGELVDAYLDAGVRLESVVAFEPDPANYAELVAALGRHAELPTLALPLAVGGTTALVRFSADGTTGATIDAVGDTVLQCVRIDDLYQSWPTTHVKLDIEGAEPEALEGMTTLLTEQRPRLAVSAYHRPDHLWTLLLQLADFGLDYRFHLRSYGEQTFDSVLYAVPA